MQKKQGKVIKRERQKKKKKREREKQYIYKTIKRTERFPTREWQLDQKEAYQQVNGNQTRE